MSKLGQIKIPLNLISETPEKWVIVKIINNFDDDIYKVFATWAGGYSDGDRWKMNSGITHVEQDEDYYYFYGYSGSCYKCHKNGYGVMTSYGQSILDNIITTAKENDVSIEIMDDTTNWINLEL